MYLLTLFTCLEINDSIREIDYLLVIRENILESIIHFVGTDSKKCKKMCQFLKTFVFGPYLLKKILCLK